VSSRKAQHPKLSFVIPVFRAEGIIGELFTRLKTVADSLDQHFECIFVEDGGEDGSWAQIEELAKKDRRVRGLRLTRNFGQHNAVLSGIRAARGAIIVTLDDDLQNPPEEIPKLLDRLAQGFDVVYGAPDRHRQPLLRRIATQITLFASKQSMGHSSAQRVSSFRAIRSSLRDVFRAFEGPIVNIDVLLTWGTSRFSTVTVRHEPRQSGNSGYTISGLIFHAFNQLTGFTIWPLQLASIAGLVSGLCGFIALTFVLGRYLLQGNEVPGFTFIASLIALFFGINLSALGMFGEYLARVHLRLMGRPSYVVVEEISAPADKSDGPHE
jgi:glycosyltransferase involved in cell wall biosynthesis